jgi:hypothetical protein
MTASDNSTSAVSVSVGTLRKRMRSLRVATMVVALALSALEMPAQDNAHEVDWTRGVPPARYIQPSEKPKIEKGDLQNPNPALDFDLNGDGKKTAWSIPVTIDGGFGTTDENGNLVFLVGIPDPKGLTDPKYLGWGQDHYSPRFKKKGGKAEGDIIGKCVYEWGRNLWYLAFVDANKNKRPDQFLKSWWRSRNGQELIQDPTDATKKIPNPSFNERTYFVTDLTAAKIQYEKVVRDASQPNLEKLFSFGEAQIEDMGPDPTPDAPSSSDAGAGAVVQQTRDDQVPLETNGLENVNQQIAAGESFQVYAEVKNTDYTNHTFYFAALGINTAISGLPTPFMLGPGQSAPYTLTVAAIQPGWASVTVLAWSDALTYGDGALDTVFFNVH